MKNFKEILVDGTSFTYDGDEPFEAKAVLAAINRFLTESCVAYGSLRCEVKLENIFNPFDHEMDEDVVLSVRVHNIVIEYKENTYSDHYPYYLEKSVTIPVSVFLDWKNGGTLWRAHVRESLKAQIEKKIAFHEGVAGKLRERLGKI